MIALIPRWALAAIIGALLIVIGVRGFALESVRAELAEAKAEASSLRELAARQAQNLITAVLKAEHESKKRETDLRAAAIAAATESDGLRNDLDAARSELGKLSRDAAIERAAAIGAVLAQCAARHQDLAQRCDRHTNDLRTMIEAWPK